MAITNEQDVSLVIFKIQVLTPILHWLAIVIMARTFN
jgi:hypothetical protein